MKKSVLTSRLALATKTTEAEAADYLDFTVLSILKSWKHGHSAHWPGLGVFSRELRTQQARKSAKSEVR